MPTLDELTEAVLRTLYIDRGLTDSEIAKEYDTYQVKVSRLRAKYGITTVLKSDRTDIPATLSPRLTSLLIGSMLGDGALRSTGSLTARLEEHHSVKQRAYLDWKVAEWGPFITSVIQSDKREHVGFKLLTHASRIFHPYWRLFYPTGTGAKSFAGLDPTLVDDFALAVWFMDDGSRTQNYVRFSVGPELGSQQVQLAILRRHGIRGHLYESGGDWAIHVQDRTSLNRFLDLVRPHLHVSLSYKLDIPSPKRGAAPRHLLSVETLAPMVQRGMTASQIGAVLGTSRQSVLRALDRHNLPKHAPGRPSAENCVRLSPPEADAQLSRLVRDAPDFIETAVSVLSKTDTPPQVLSDVELNHDIDLLRRAPTRVEDSTIVSVSKAGSALCSHFFPHKWDARYRDQPSFRRAWYDSEILKRAVGFQLRVGDPVTMSRVARAVQVVIRAPTNFRPCFAKALVEHFCPEGGLVLDPCAGYGGRAAGTLAAGRQYVGVDPHPDAERAHRAMAAAMGTDLSFHNRPFEDVDLGSLQADLILTSPPYFSVERYSDTSSQSWVRYPTWAEWREGFLKPFVDKCWAHLRPGRVLCVNTKDVRLGRQVAPIGADLVRLAVERGFSHEGTLSLPIGRVGKNVQSEPIFVFRRPGI